MKTTTILKCERLSYQVRGKTLLNDVGFTIEPGQRVAVLGHNGAGKSTLIDLLTHALEPDSGSVSVFGQPFQKIDRQRIGVVFDRLQAFVLLKVKEVIRYFRTIYGLPGALPEPELLEAVQLQDHLDKQIRYLSKGERKKVWVLLALMHNPEFLILDEATSELDPFSRRRVWDKGILSNPNRTVLFTTHSWEEAQEHADSIIFLSKGVMPMPMISTNRLLSEEYLPFDRKVVVRQEPALTAFLEEQQAEFYEEDEQLHILPSNLDELLGRIARLTSSYSIMNTSLMDVYALSTKKLTV
ncbi:MAG: ABC transporter ATP-binding protein [bacterium]|nr:ABC transporter ATP-binding protein [bacterium]